MQLMLTLLPVWYKEVNISGPDKFFSSFMVLSGIFRFKTGNVPRGLIDGPDDVETFPVPFCFAKRL